jgi:hypothetical protein
MKRVKRLNLTLVELFIAMALASILISTLSYFYFQLHSMGERMDQLQQEHFQRRYLQNRLADVIPKIPATAFFFTGEPITNQKAGTPNLVFEFDNCVRLDKRFAYLVTGRLYLDDAGRLILIRLPDPNFWETGAVPPIKREILGEGIEEFSFRFFIPPATVGKKRGQIPEALSGTWQRDWKKDWKAIPAVIEITLKWNGEELRFAYPLPNQTEPITYTQ